MANRWHLCFPPIVWYTLVVFFVQSGSRSSAGPISFLRVKAFPIDGILNGVSPRYTVRVPAIGLRPPYARVQPVRMISIRRFADIARRDVLVYLPAG